MRCPSKRGIPRPSVAALLLCGLLAPGLRLSGRERGPGTFPLSAGGDAQKIFLVPNFHPACCGWLADWSTERNYCANNYLDHLDRVRDDPDYAFALSEVPNMIALLNFHPGRIAELKRRLKEGRVELCNAFFLECTINLPGGEALVRNGLEGLRWQERVFGARPRFAWIIDVTGTHEQMAQITAGLGLDAMFYTRHNPTGSAAHWAVSPDGSRTLAVAPGHYSEWNPVFTAKDPLDRDELLKLKADARDRLGRTTPGTGEAANSATPWDGSKQTTPPGAPVLILAGNGDYSIAPARREYPAEFLRQFKAVAPEFELAFTTPGRYVDAVLPAAKSGSLRLPVMRGGTRFSFNSFWIENPRVKTAFRLCEQGLAAAEMLSTVAGFRAGREYPSRTLYHGWLQLLLNMDRNSLWGSAGGMVFEHPASWAVSDRIASIKEIAGRAAAEALRALTEEGSGVAFFNPLNWERRDPVLVKTPGGRGLKGAACQAMPGTDAVLCRPTVPSIGIASLEMSAGAPAPSRPVALPESVETRHYSVRIDPATGALVSLKLKPSGREILGGPANVIVAEKPNAQAGDPGDHVLDREERRVLAASSGFPAEISVREGPLATIVEARSAFFGGGALVRTIRIYRDYPRVDFATELNDIPDRTAILAEFPLAEDVVEVRRGIPFGFSHGAWARPNPELHGWTKGVVPAVRWSHYALAGGGGAALLDRGLSGRELTGRTPVLFLLNATDNYYGYPNAWLSGRGRHVLEYALTAHEADWEKARIPQLAWEYGNPPVALAGRGAAGAGSFVRTSANVIVEAMRREGADIELRLAECLGRPGEAEVSLDLPHERAALTDLTGANPRPLEPGAAYRFPVRPQQIVTMRFRTNRPVPEIEPLVDWNPLVPEAKRAALNTRIDKKGHPPRGDL